jgi:hypothetical protein
MASKTNTEDFAGNKNRIYDYPGNAKSDVWIYFGFLNDPKTQKLDMTRAACKICGKIYVNNGEY